MPLLDRLLIDADEPLRPGGPAPQASCGRARHDRINLIPRDLAGRVDRDACGTAQRRKDIALRRPKFEADGPQAIQKLAAYRSSLGDGKV